VRLNSLPKATLGLRTVKENRADQRLIAKEPREVVHRDRSIIDIRVQAPAAVASRQHVPDRNPAERQLPDPLRVSNTRIKPKQLPHDRPERIARMCVILPRPQRRLARHAPQNEDPSSAVCQRSKTLHVRHGRLPVTIQPSSCCSVSISSASLTSCCSCFARSLSIQHPLSNSLLPAMRAYRNPLASAYCICFFIGLGRA